MKKQNILALVSLASLALLPCAQSAVITWGTATNISGDSNVSTAGTRVTAQSMGTTGVTSATVNGVTFDAFVLTTLGTTSTISSTDTRATIATTGTTTLGGFNGFGSASTPFSNLSAAYQDNLETGIFANNNRTFTLTLSGLTSGYEYLFQFWSNDSRASQSRHTLTATTGANFVTIGSRPDPNPTSAGVLGQFATGTFTADATTQAINFSGSAGYLNDFQLRQTAIPEPTTAVLVGMGAVALALLRRRKKQ